MIESVPADDPRHAVVACLAAVSDFAIEVLTQQPELLAALDEPLTLLPGSYRLRSSALDGEGLRLFDTIDREVTVTGSAREYGLARLPHAWRREGE